MIDIEKYGNKLLHLIMATMFISVSLPLFLFIIIFLQQIHRARIEARAKRHARPTGTSEVSVSVQDK